MPEGHSVHRVALQLGADFVGRRVAASSPQGRFAAGAALLDGLEMSEAFAVGKHLLVGFGSAERDEARWLRVHLGLYGAWDFHGRVSPIGAEALGVGSIGAPRVRRAVRIGELERALDDGAFPPEPVGQVRLRLLTEESVADLRGPSRCEVIDWGGVEALLAKAGPDPRAPFWADPEGEFVRRLRARRVAVGQLLMDQSVVSGIGNIYRAEMLFRARLDPFTPGAAVPAELARELWRDWERLLDVGVATAVMLTRDDVPAEQALADRSVRWAVYGRAGEPCYRCGTRVALADMAGRKLFWCPGCQV